MDSKVAWLQYMGYYQAGSYATHHGAMAISPVGYPPGYPPGTGSRRQASQTHLRMFDIEEMGPNMAMDQLVPHPSLAQSRALRSRRVEKCSVPKNEVV